MTSWFAVLGLGFVLGMRHATDPDHVVAVATIVSHHRRAFVAAWVGVWWGIGHTLTVLVVGGAMVLLGWVVPPRLGLSMEFSVGLMLILLGGLTLVRLWKTSAPGSRAAHSHDPEGTPIGWLDGHFGRSAPYRAVRPLVVGMVHGLAGSAAVALFVLATIASPAWSILYLLLFGAGTVVGMMVITAAIALPFQWSGAAAPRLMRALTLAAGLGAIGLGCLLAYRIGWVDGLFTADLTWTPH